jgi:hypothetical protein
MRRIGTIWIGVCCAIMAAISGSLVVASSAMATGGDGAVAVLTADGIEVVEPDGSGAHLIVEGAFSGRAGEMSWSATGSHIAYVGPDNEVWVARADGSHAHVVSLPSQAGVVEWPQWSPDGRITYNVGRQTFVVDADASHLARLPQSFWTSWLPDGRLVLLRLSQRQWHLAIGRADGAGFRTISPSDPNPGGVLPMTSPWQLSDSGLVAYHFEDGSLPISEQRVEYGSMSGRSFRFFTPESYVSGGQSVSLAPSGSRAIIGRGALASVWDIDPTTGTQTYANLGFSYPENGDRTEMAWQPRCTISSTASNSAITGSAGDDLICVRGDDDTVRGLGGDDIVYVTGHQDTVRGGAGRDVVVVHGGSNVVRGGRNADTINVREGARHGTLVRGGTGVDVCIADSADRLHSCAG